jgi:hypothetical protein
VSAFVTVAHALVALAISVGTSVFIFSVWAGILYNHSLSLPTKKSRHRLVVLVQLQQIIARKEKFTDETNEGARQLAQGDRPRQWWVFPLVLATACLLGGGIAIPLLAGAKAELVYANTVGAISALCAGAALIKSRKPLPN